MITCKLSGKLGNQMFQIATCYAYSRNNNIEYSVEIPYAPKASVYGKWYKFNNVDYCDELETYKEEYKDHSFSYVALPTGLCNIRISGAFQSYKYFDGYRKDIINLFSEVTDGYDIKEGVVSLHVRRGDYLKYPNHHPVVDMGYYKKAIEYFNSLGYNKFLIFSDDIYWCKEQFIENEANKFSFDDHNDPFEAMGRMASCEHNIIANSTFSWWAAYLNKNENKIVVYPSKWFGSAYKHFDTKDLFKPEWIELSN